MQKQPRNTKLIFIGLGVLVVLGVLFIFLGSHHKKGSSTVQAKAGSGQTVTKTDPTSGETLVEQAGKVPETNGGSTDGPLFLGFDKLINQGLTIQQLDSIQTAITSYPPFTTSSAQISLAADDIVPVSPSDSGDAQQRWSIKSHIVVNSKDTYRVQFFYSGIGNVEVYIYSADGKTQLFDSGSIDNSTADQSSPDS
jgi:hypothetical protein